MARVEKQKGSRIPPETIFPDSHARGLTKAIPVQYWFLGPEQAVVCRLLGWNHRHVSWERVWVTVHGKLPFELAKEGKKRDARASPLEIFRCHAEALSGGVARTI